MMQRLCGGLVGVGVEINATLAETVDKTPVV
jgi:hypothetical protein